MDDLLNSFLFNDEVVGAETSSVTDYLDELLTREVVGISSPMYTTISANNAKDPKDVIDGNICDHVDENMSELNAFRNHKSFAEQPTTLLAETDVPNSLSMVERV